MSDGANDENRHANDENRHANDENENANDENGDDSIVTRRRLLAAAGATALLGVGYTLLGGGGSGTGLSFTARDCDSTTSLSSSDVEEGGTLSKDCYRVENTLTVGNGILTLEAGVQIEFAENAGLKFESGGGLRANGTDSSPVVLTGTKEDRGHWKGLFFDGSQTSENRMENTLVQHAGGGSWNPNWKNGAVVLKNGSALALDRVLLRENGRMGVLVMGAGDQLSVSNSKFESNDRPARTHANGASAFTPDNAFEGNDESAIEIGVDASDTVQAEQTWPDPGVPFRVVRNVHLKAPVTVAEGATFVFDETKGLNVPEGGRLTVEGTEDDPVTFTGREAVPGFWKGLRLNNTSSVKNVVEHAVVEYAGNSAWNPNHQPAGIFIQGNDVALVVRDSTIRGNANMGLIGGGPESTLTLENNLFEGNDAPLFVQANHVGGMTGDNTFEGNEEEYVFLGAPGFGGARTTLTDPASWPALDAPYRPKIFVGVEAPLEVSPGATFEFEQNKGMQIQGDGRLKADAFEGETITFSGAEDETGFWKGLHFVNSQGSDNVLRNTVIENGGSSHWGGDISPTVANLLLGGGDKPATVAISDSTIRGSGKFGIAIRSGASELTGCSGMTFENNAEGDTYNIEAGEPISSCQ